MIKKYIKKAIKNIVYPLAFSFKADRILQTINRNKRMAIMYHGVTACNCFKINGRHVPAEEFEKHLIYYKSNFHIVPLAELFDIKRNNTIPKKTTIAITFDDGFINNLDVALPLLEKHQVPATFFVTTAPLVNEDTILWSDLLEIACAFLEKNQVQMGDKVFTRQGKYRWISGDHINLNWYLNEKSPEEKSVLMNEWKEKHNIKELKRKINSHCFALMGKEDIKKLASSPLVEIGSHTHSHHHLSTLDDKTLEFELTYSKSLLENIIDKKVESLAFPNGNYNDRVLDFCKKAGYKNLIAVGLNDPSEKSSPDIVPRMGISSSDNLAFNMLNLHLFFNRQGF